MNDPAGIDHVFAEERRGGPVAHLVAHRPRHPVLDLQDDAQQDVEDEAPEQDDLEYLYNVIGAHEMGRSVEPLPAVVP
jgi:hypothetical protein